VAVVAVITAESITTVTLNSIVHRAWRLNAIRKWGGTDERKRERKRERGREPGEPQRKTRNGKMLVEYHDPPHLFPPSGEARTLSAWFINPRRLVPYESYACESAR